MQSLLAFDDSVFIGSPWLRFNARLRPNTFADIVPRGNQVNSTSLPCWTVVEGKINGNKVIFLEAGSGTS